MKGITLLHTLLLILSCNTSQGQFWKVSEAERLSSDINTSAEESIPVFLKSANSLYFVRTFDPSNKGGMNDQDIWYSEDINGEFQPAQNLPGLNNKLNNAVLGFS